MPLRFPKLAAAVAEFERTAPDRKKLWDRLDDPGDIAEADTVRRAAEFKVRSALDEDYGNPEPSIVAMSLTIDEARRLAKLSVR